MRVRNVKGAKEYLEMHPDIVIEDYQNHIGKWKDVFQNDNPIYLEIGMGKGKFIIENAQKNPNINYIGLEKDVSITYKALNKILECEKIPNLRIICADASNIDLIFDKGEINKLYLNFSDPWPKSRHEKRRLTSKVFLEKYKMVIQGLDREFLRSETVQEK